TDNVMMNSTRPISMSAERYSESAASVNSFAITADIVCCGANSDAEILGLLPITIVTAIVSPSARPKPSMTAPMMPVRANSSAARSSVRNTSGALIDAGDSSEMKTAIPSATGAAMISARMDEYSVPQMNGSAPNSPETGSHV